MYFIIKGLNETNSKKCIIYCMSLNLCKSYISYANIINDKLKYNLNIFEITYKTTKKDRKNILEKFSNDSENINIIFSIRVLDEGIDIACCDSVFITNLNDNALNLLQRISRCNRIDEDNKDKIANIFIWTDKTDKLNKMLDTKFTVVGETKTKTKTEPIIKKIKININDHVNNRNGIWSCDICKYNTRDSSNLKRHLKTNQHINKFYKYEKKQNAKIKRNAERDMLIYNRLCNR